MDGSDREKVVQGVGKSTGLSIDMENSNLYWTDQDLLTISYTSLKSKVGTIYHIKSSGHPYALALYSSNLYLTDWKEHTVSRISLPASNTSNLTVLQTGIDYVMDIAAYYLVPSTGLDSPCYNNTCSSLCIPTFNKSNCACSSHYTLQPDNS